MYTMIAIKITVAIAILDIPIKLQKVLPKALNNLKIIWLVHTISKLNK